MTLGPVIDPTYRDAQSIFTVSVNLAVSIATPASSQGTGAIDDWSFQFLTRVGGAHKMDGGLDSHSSYDEEK
ncbi:hypothetical protein ACLOJK_020956 [Asimina triloba]